MKMAMNGKVSAAVKFNLPIKRIEILVVKSKLFFSPHEKETLAQYYELRDKNMCVVAYIFSHQIYRKSVCIKFTAT